MEIFMFELKGKYVSILGDSISTYKSVSNDNTANSNIDANPYFYHGEFPLDKTYWMQIIKAFDMRLCVDNSWSGGNLSGADDFSAGVNRAEQLSRDDGTKPDLIIIFMGINDLGRGVDILVFSDDYEKTLNTIKKNYPEATVCCVNLPNRGYLKQRTEAFCQAINSAVKKAGSNFFVADLYHSRLNNDSYYMNTVDGLHPDEDGMKIIADIIEEAIKEYIQGANVGREKEQKEY